MSTTDTKRQVDPDERWMDIVGTAIVIFFVALAIACWHDDVSAWFNDTTAHTENVQVCPNTQPPLDQSYWKLYASWPPNTGIYKVTYSASADGTDDVASIKLVTTDTSRCP